MLKNMMRTVMGGLLAASCLPAGSAWAQQAVMDEFYGNGVHNFYDRDFSQAMQNLSVAIDGGSKDPRAYYYRGLAKLRCGDTYGAQDDMYQGAALESADVDQFYPVSKSLERVQGAERRELERYRAMARAQARDRQLRRDAVRYEQRRRTEAEVLRSVPVGPPPAPLGVVPTPTLGTPAPAAAPGAVSAPPVAAPPATPPPPAGAADDNPFGDTPADAPAADAPAGDSPFDTPAETPPAATPPAATPPASVPPVATPPAAAPPAAAPPATEAPAGDDPFAEAPAAEAPAAAAPATEAPAAEMPAAAAPAAEPAATEDPFADDPK